uniref:Uncharacterized protein n=1 Tax=Hucho hucho TaxID=62062 RepID=A0A4W5QSR0_9TELE
HPCGPFTDVYEPAEDSFPLIDAIEQDADRLKKISCTDVNPAADQCTLETSCCNGVSLQPIITDLRHTLGMFIFLFQD